MKIRYSLLVLSLVLGACGGGFIAAVSEKTDKATLSTINPEPQTGAKNSDPGPDANGDVSINGIKHPGLLSTKSQAKQLNQDFGNNEPTIKQLTKQFQTPEQKFYPETWFHLNGKNISQAGLTADLEAIKYSGISGIHLFNKKGPAYPNVEQVSILSPEWEQMIGHVANETERLGLNLTFQNCPGWSMAGGPWVPVEEAQRELIHQEYQLIGGQTVHQPLPISPEFLTEDRNYQDVRVLAFKTPADNNKVDLAPDSYRSNNQSVPWSSIFDIEQRVEYQIKPFRLRKDEPFRSYQKQGIHPIEGKASWVELTYDEPITLRSIELPPVRYIFTDRQYPKTNIDIQVEAKLNGVWQTLTTLPVPSTHWYDTQYNTTLAVPTTTSNVFRLTFLKDPLFLSFVKMHGRSFLHNHETKAAKSSRQVQQFVAQQVEDSQIVASQSMFDLSNKMDKSGVLNWQAPEGNWTVIRFGHVNMLRTNRPAEPEATGWETSKLDKEAIENHLRNGMMGHLMRDNGPLDGHQVHGMLIDSWESYVPTWTMHKERLIQEFAQRRGYDMTPFLPATLGYVVDSVDISNRFLRDLRQTMDDLYVENFFAHFRTVAHDMGSKVYTEGAVGETLPGDPLRYYGVSDYPMTEFWFPKAPSNQKEAKPVYAAASAYHLYNKPFLAAEAATQLYVKWHESPKDINYLINENFAKGINHLVFHTFSHTPQTHVVPGSSFGGSIGFPMLRTQTWWRHSPQWMTQIARAQYLLQQGEFVADVLRYLGDDLDRHPFDTAPFPEGYKFDYFNEEVLQQKVRMKDGKIHVQDAGNYRIIMLRDSERMLLSTLEKLRELVQQGAIILGKKPQSSPSLMDDAQDLAQLQLIADALWGSDQAQQKSGVNKVGKGRVYWGQSLTEVLKQEQIKPDLTVPGDTDIRWSHRQTHDADIYYVTNQGDHAIDVNLQFRMGIGQPMLWDIETGEQQDAQIWRRGSGNIEPNNSVTSLVVSLAPHGSQFVVFDKTRKTKPAYRQFRSDNAVLLSAEVGWSKHYKGDESPVKMTNELWHVDQTGRYELVGQGNNPVELHLHANRQHINTPWDLTFEAGWDTPIELSFEQLMPLQKHENIAVKHYSGSIVYQTSFEYHQVAAASSTLLDLGTVYNIAEVRLNGKLVATKLSAPYVFDVSEYLVGKNNQLAIVVTNTWRNQLIFDITRPQEQKKTWTTNPPEKHDKTLDPSGLVGPVVLRSVTVNTLN